MIFKSAFSFLWDACMIHYYWLVSKNAFFQHLIEQIIAIFPINQIVSFGEKNFEKITEGAHAIECILVID